LKAVVTICLTNWARPKLTAQLIDSIKAQTIRSNIFLWNNGSPCEFSGVNWQVDSNKNRICWPRWFMAFAAPTPFVCIIDDDVLLRKTTSLEFAIACISEADRSTIAGIAGVVLDAKATYRKSIHLGPMDVGRCRNTRCDVIKGMLMLMRTESLIQNVRIGAPRAFREDDIAVCSMMSGGRLGKHVCLRASTGHFASVDATNSLWRRKGHFLRRELACLKYFPEYKARVQQLGDWALPR
jgi:hypothetical protein